jgi:hypothetical protein
MVGGGAHSATLVLLGESVAAIQAATGGSVCMRRRRMPRDFSSMAELVKGHAPVQLIVRGDSYEAPYPFLLRPVPLQIAAAWDGAPDAHDRRRCACACGTRSARSRRRASQRRTSIESVMATAPARPVM